MPFAANIAVAQEVIMAAIMIALFIGVGAGKVLGLRKNFSRILQTFRKILQIKWCKIKKFLIRAQCDLQKKAFRINSGARVHLTQ